MLRGMWCRIRMLRIFCRESIKVGSKGRCGMASLRKRLEEEPTDVMLKYQKVFRAGGLGVMEDREACQFPARDQLDESGGICTGEVI
jgi:hypothetical protein